jgi:FdhD protein
MASVTGVKEWNNGELRSLDDYLVGEEPLEIRVGDLPISVTMRTPGHDLELAAGFLFTEGLITSRAQIASVRNEPDATQNGANRVRIDLTPGVVLDPEATRRNFYTTSSCGVCGKASIDAVRVRHIAPLAPAPAPAALAPAAGSVALPPAPAAGSTALPPAPAAGSTALPDAPDTLLIDPELLCQLPDRLRAAQPVFERTGGLHAAGLFTSAGELLILREDVGRHNAVDKVIGWALANDLLPLGTSVLMVSGRGGFEIVQKALVAGVAVLASVSAPSDLAVNLAREFGMTLIGFLRGRRFIIYSGAGRIASAMPPR